jgi:hypothetical protein
LLRKAFRAALSFVLFGLVRSRSVALVGIQGRRRVAVTGEQM